MTVAFISDKILGYFKFLSREMICHFSSVGYKFSLHDDVFRDGRNYIA